MFREEQIVEKYPPRSRIAGGPCHPNKDKIKSVPTISERQRQMLAGELDPDECVTLEDWAKITAQIETTKIELLKLRGIHHFEDE